MVYQSSFQVPTHRRAQWVDITGEVQRCIDSSKLRCGVCLVASLHTTGGITINENADPDVERDFFSKLDELVPRDGSYRHNEGNSDSHIKASLVGLSVQIAFCDGRMIQGTWQSIYFCEFDGPRSRRVSVTAIGE